MIISYSIAAGVVEGKLIPELNKKLKSVKNFHENLKTETDRASKTIEETKLQLTNEVKRISALKVKTEEVRTLVPLDELDYLRDEIVAAAQKLIESCNEYQVAHGKKNI